MSAARSSSPSPSREERRAARLLKLGRDEQRRAVDALLDDLAAHAPARLEELLASGPAGTLGPPLETFVAGGAGLAALADAKDRCKVAPERDLRERLERLAGYFTAIAAALAHHRTRICSRSSEELEPILLDLAAATPSPWSELFSRATLEQSSEP